MHRSDTLQWQVVVHHREHTLLHFTAVPCVDDNLFAAGSVECYASLRVQAEFLIVLNLGLRCIVNNEVRCERFKFFSSRADKHVGYEVCLPCYLNDEAYSHASVLVSTAEAINYIEVLVRKLLLGNFLNLCPYSFAHGVVIVLVFRSCPPYCVM